LTESITRTSAGRWFQALGPAPANDRAPKCVTVRVMTRSPRAVHRSLCLLPTDDDDDDDDERMNFNVA